jgi:hypothetical protein
MEKENVKKQKAKCKMAKYWNSKFFTFVIK